MPDYQRRKCTKSDLIMEIVKEMKEKRQHLKRVQASENKSHHPSRAKYLKSLESEIVLLGWFLEDVESLD